MIRIIPSSFCVVLLENNLFSLALNLKKKLWKLFVNTININLKGNYIKIESDFRCFEKFFTKIFDSFFLNPDYFWCPLNDDYEQDPKNTIMASKC